MFSMKVADSKVSGYAKEETNSKKKPAVIRLSEILQCLFVMTSRNGQNPLSMHEDIEVNCKVLALKDNCHSQFNAMIMA